MPEANVSELVVKFALDKKIKYVFGILSSGFLEVMDILGKTEINYIGVRHEQWAGHMADAYGRITLRPQICLIAGGPGITNMVTAMATAKINYSPMLVLSDGPTRRSEGKGDFQDLNGAVITTPVSKKSQYVSTPFRVLDNLASLYDIAVTPLMGPVHLEIARDVLLETVEYDGSSPPPAPSAHFYPSEEDILEVLRLLGESSKPLLLVGEEARSGSVSRLVSEVARKLRIPICTTHTNNDAVDNSDPYYLGSIGSLGSKKAMKAMEESDLVIALGSSLPPYTFLPYYGFRYPGRETKIIQVTLNEGALGKTQNLVLGLVSGAEEFLKALLSKVDSFGGGALVSKSVLWDGWFRGLPENEPLDVFKSTQNRNIFLTLFEGLETKSIISVDAGQLCKTIVRWNRFHAPGSLLTSGNMGEVGFSIPAAIGAKLARPDLPSYAILGDGAFTMELSAILTATEYNIPIKIIVLDNSAWGSEKAYQKILYEERYFGSNLKNPNLVEVARSLGLESFYAEDPAEVRKGIRELNQLDKPGALFIRMEEDYPTPSRLLDAVRRVKRGIF